MIPLIARRFKPNPGRILSWDCKLGCITLFARDVDEAMKAYLVFFAQFDKLGYYRDGLNEDEAVWYKEAKEGDGAAAYWLLSCREDFEYEGIETLFAETP